MPYDELLGIMNINGFSPSQSVVAKEFISKVESFWSKDGEKLVTNIEKVSGLRFRSNIECYVVSNMFFEAISHPFTIKMGTDIKDLKSIFIHELLHILLVQNSSKVSPWVSKIDGDHNYKVHFPVLLCERKILERFENGFKQQKRVENLDYIWRDVNKIYPKFKNTNKDIVSFLKEYVISR